MTKFFFGTCSMCARATRVCRFSEEKLGQMLSTQFQAIMLLVRHRQEEKG